MSVNGLSDIQKLLQLQKQRGGIKPARKVQQNPLYSMERSIFESTNMVSGQNSGVSNRGRANNTSNIAQANIIRSVGNTNSSGANVNKSSENNGQNREINLGDIDYNNLASYSDTELQSIKSQLQEIKDSNIPRFLENSINKKLDKVKAEADKRANANGDKTRSADSDEKSSEEVPSGGDKSGATSGAKAAEAGEQEIKNTSSKMQNLKKTLKSKDKAYKKEQQRTEKEIKKNDKEIQKINTVTRAAAAENNELNAKVEELNAKIEEENTRAMTRSAGNDETQGSDSSGNTQNYQNELSSANQKIQSNSKIISKNSVKTKSLYAKNNKQVRMLQRSAKTYQAYSKQATAQTEEASSTKEKILKVANTVSMVGSITSTAGMATSKVGLLLKASGTAMMSNPATAAAGAAKVAFGVKVYTVGTGLETAGNWATTASGAAQTAVYASEGNITGAVMAGVSTAMSASSALKSTKALGEGLQASKAASQGADNIKNTSSEALKKNVSTVADSASKADKVAAGSQTANKFMDGVSDKGKEALGNVMDKSAKITKQEGMQLLNNTMNTYSYFSNKNAGNSGSAAVSPVIRPAIQAKRRRIA